MSENQKRRINGSSSSSGSMSLLACGTCCALLLGAVALVLGIISVLHTENHPGEKIHTFCVDVRDRSLIDSASLIVGRVGFDSEDKRVCIDVFYSLASGCTLDTLVIKGPVNSVDGLDSNNTIATFVAANTMLQNGTIGPIATDSRCVHISSANLRRVLKNPALSYIEATATGACAAYEYRDHITALCHNPEFEMSSIDDDDSYYASAADDDDDNNPSEVATILHAKDASKQLRRGKSHKSKH
jgi:hypothetical protein